jgi:hypothetical protein
MTDRYHGLLSRGCEIARGGAGSVKKVAAGCGGQPAAREPGLGTGRGGDVTGVANQFLIVSAR